MQLSYINLTHVKMHAIWLVFPITNKNVFLNKILLLIPIKRAHKRNIRNAIDIKNVK